MVLLTFLLLPIIAFFVMYVGLFFPLAPVVDSSLEHYRFASYTLPVLVGSFLANLDIRELLRRFRLVGQPVIEIERFELKFSFKQLLYLGIILYWGYALVAAFVEVGMTDFIYMVLMACYLVGIAFILLVVSSKKYLTREGISQFSGSIKWGDILSYHWGRPDGEVYNLGFHQRTGAVVKVKVPVSKKDEIDSFIKAWGYTELRLPFGSIFLLPLVIYAGGALSPHIPKSLIFAVAIFGFFFHAGFYFKKVSIGFRLKKADILLELGRRESKYYLLGGLLLFFLSILCSSVPAFQGEVNLDYLTMAAMYAVISLRYIVLSLSKVYLAEEGIFRFDGTIKWGYITDYSWGKRKKDKINLTIKTHYDTTFSVRADQQAEIDRIIFTRLGWHLRQDFNRPVGQPAVAHLALGS